MHQRLFPTVLVLSLIAASGCAAPDGEEDDNDLDLSAAASEGEAVRGPWAPAPWRPRGPRPSGGLPDPDVEEPGVTDPIPYGFWGLNGYTSTEGLDDLGTRFELSIFQTASSDPDWVVGTLLPLARTSGVPVTLRMTGSPSHYTDASGNFDIDAWKTMLDAWRDSGVDAYIADGTLVGHMILDDIANYSGADPTGDELDEMARYSKAMLPGLMTFVRNQATTLPVPSGGAYQHVDAAVNQYKATYGDPVAYGQTQRAAALDLDLGIINGLNIANGGDGSSGQPGWESGRYAMSAEEIRTYGFALADVEGLGMFLNWEYDGEEIWADGSVGADYFNEPAQQAALAELGLRVASHSRTPLLRD